MANNKVAPVFYSKQSSQHLPMEDGMLIDSKFIESGSLISSDAGNLITEGSDGGMRLTASDLICDAGNCDNLLQTCDDGKIFVERPNIVSKQNGNLITEDRVDGSAMLSIGDVVSEDAGNTISKGTDGKLYTERPNIVSKQDGNLLIEDRADDSAMLGFGDAVSEDAGNLVSKGKDGKLAVMGKNLVSTDKANLIKVTDGGRLELVVDDMLSDADCNVIDIDKDGKVKLCLGMDYDLISGKMNLTGNDGAIIDSITIPSAASILESVELVKDPANIGSGYFLKLVFLVSAERKQVIYADMNSLSDIYKAGKGIELTNGYTINVKLASNSGLEFDSNGGLKLSFDINQYAKKSDIPAPPDLSGYAKKTDIPDLSGYAKKTDIPALTGGKGISYTTTSKNGTITGTIAADLHLEAIKSGSSKLLRVVDGDGNLLGTNSVSLGAGLDVEDDGKSGRIVATATAYTLESHAATSTKYGGGTAANYGHVRLTDSATDTHSAADSVAVSPKALSGILSRLATLEDADSGGLSLSSLAYYLPYDGDAKVGGGIVKDGGDSTTMYSSTYVKYSLTGTYLCLRHSTGGGTGSGNSSNTSFVITTNPSGRELVYEHREDISESGNGIPNYNLYLLFIKLV